MVKIIFFIDLFAPILHKVVVFFGNNLHQIWCKFTTTIKIIDARTAPSNVAIWVELSEQYQNQSIKKAPYLMPKKGADLIHILVGVTLESDIFIILSFIVKLFNFSISIELQKKMKIFLLIIFSKLISKTKFCNKLLIMPKLQINIHKHTHNPKKPSTSKGLKDVN